MDKTIKEEWKIFCRTLYSNVLRMEADTQLKISQSRNNGSVFSERRKLLDKIKWCEKSKIEIMDSIKNKEFIFKDGDMEYIQSKGYEAYFRCRDCIL